MIQLCVPTEGVKGQKNVFNLRRGHDIHCRFLIGHGFTYGLIISNSTNQLFFSFLSVDDVTDSSVSTSQHTQIIIQIIRQQTWEIFLLFINLSKRKGDSALLILSTHAFFFIMSSSRDHHHHDNSDHHHKKKYHLTFWSTIAKPFDSSPTSQ